MTTDTIELWRGEFGTEYTKRNNRVPWSDRVPFWRRMVAKTDARTFLDVGCNAGWNMLALRTIGNDLAMTGVDINEGALVLASQQGLDVLQVPADQIVEKFGPACADMVITSGVLIHIAPSDLQRVMRAIVDASARWVLAIEYPSDQEQELSYRGQEGALWKRPYGHLYEQLGLELRDTGVADGFVECNYWLLEKV